MIQLIIFSITPLLTSNQNRNGLDLRTGYLPSFLAKEKNPIKIKGLSYWMKKINQNNTIKNKFKKKLPKKLKMINSQ